MAEITISTLLFFGVAFAIMFLYVIIIYKNDEKDGKSVNWNSEIWQVSFGITFMVIFFIFFIYIGLYNWLIISFIPYALLILNEKRIERELTELDLLEEKYRDLRIKGQKRNLESKIAAREKEEREELIRSGKYIPESDIEKNGQNIRKKWSFFNKTKPKKRKHIPNKLKDRIWRRDQNKCVDCGSKEFLEIDHIVPHSRGGKDTYRNLQLLCQDCNRKKADKMI